MPHFGLSDLQADPDITLSPLDERDFRAQFIKRSRRLGLSTDPDSPFQLFRSRAQFKDLKSKGLRFADQEHLFGRFKLSGHPTQFKLDAGRESSGRQLFGRNASTIDLLNENPENFINTITDKKATEEDFSKALEVRMELSRKGMSLR